MRARAFALALVGAALLSGCAHRAAPMPDDARVQAIVAGTGFSGAIVLGRGGDVVYARGLGDADRERGLPFTPATASDGASIAKTFAAAAVHLLVAEGRLGLDDPVVRHVAEFPHRTTRLRPSRAHVGLPTTTFHVASRRRRRTRGDAARAGGPHDAPPFVPARFILGLGFAVAAFVSSGSPPTHSRFVQPRLSRR